MQISRSCCSVTKSCLTLCDPMDCSMPGSSVIHYILEFAQTHVHWVGDAIIISSYIAPLSLCLLSFPTSESSKKSAIHIRWPKCWSFSFSFSPFNEYSGLISFRIDWFNLLAIQGTLKSLLQHHNLKVSILWCSSVFMVQLSHPYMTTGKP